MADHSRAGFEDRSHAGAALGMELAVALPAGDYTVLGLLRGGVPVAAGVARSLGAALGAMAVRKLGVPSNPELAFGAVAHYRDTSGRYLNADIHRRAAQYFGPEELSSLENGSRADAKVMADTFKQFAPEVEGRGVILCDDGIATGATMKAALDLLKTLAPARVIVAAPVAPQEVIDQLKLQADAVFVLLRPANFTAVGAFYRDFDQVNQDQVRLLLQATE